jgi:uncharacterized repeat protein (TIGR03803 family)
LDISSAATQEASGQTNSKQRLTVLYTFTGRPNGAFPHGSLTYVNGRFFGATDEGGRSFCSEFTGCGTIYAITPSGKRERVLHEFSRKKDYSDGQFPNGGLLYEDGTFYGTTSGEGAGNGILFSVFCQTGRCVEKVLKNVGGIPNGDLVEENGTFYGTTQMGGPSFYGTVFTAAPSGEVNTLYSFKGGSDGERPFAGLTDVNGTFYGTTGGQPYGPGTVFKITPSGEETVLHQFGGTSEGARDGTQPSSKMIDVNGTLYGTTSWGGAHQLGTVFSITTSGIERVVYSFAGDHDGENPASPLISANGALYGETGQGGASGNGTIYEINGSGGEHVLYNFKGGVGGANPGGGLFKLHGFLYGTTSNGGNYSDCLVFGTGCGTFFRMRL